MKIAQNIVYLLLTVYLTQGCTTSKYLYIRQIPPIAEHNVPAFVITNNLQNYTTSDLVDMCLQPTINSVSNAVYILSCNNELLARAKFDNTKRSRAIALYNQSLSNLVQFALQKTPSKRISVQLKSQDNSLELEKFQLTSAFKVLDPRLNHMEFGELGVLAVVERKNSKKGLDQYYPLEGIFRSVNFLFESVNYQSDHITLTLSYDIATKERLIYLGSQAYRQKYSPSAAYLALIEKANIDDFSLLGLIQATKAEFRRGIFAIEPLTTHKIPLIMTHGLNSDPLIWRYLTIALLNDWEINQRYQIWHFYYPSGPPPFFTAMKLRQKVKALLESMDSDTLVDQAVFIGHSMGGIITHVLTSHSDYKLWDSAFVERPEALIDGANPELENIFVFEPVFKNNTVFMLDTPHLGSDVAKSAIGYVSSWLVNLPYSFSNLFSSFIQRIGFNKLTPAMQPFRKGPNSIEVLRPGHPIMLALSELPIAGRAYSVVGSVGFTDCLDLKSCANVSDSVVNYSSAHFPMADKEIIVHSNHNSFKSEVAIDFIRQKLHEISRENMP